MHGRNFVREINFMKFFLENDFTKKLPSVEFNEDETLPHSLQIYLSKRKTFLESNLKKIYLHLLESVQIVLSYIHTEMRTKKAFEVENCSINFFLPDFYF